MSGQPFALTLSDEPCAEAHPVPSRQPREVFPPRTPTLPPTLVFLAFEDRSPRARAALDMLYTTYREPCLAFIRAWRSPAHSREEAAELLQEFFAQRIDKQDLVRNWNPGRTRFRTWLLAALRHFLLNQRRSQRRTHARCLYMEDLPTLDPAHVETPEAVFHRDWMRVLLRRALDALRTEYAGRIELFERLEPFLDMSRPPYAELARELGRTHETLKQDVCELRRRWRNALRHEVAQTVCEPQIDAELRDLMQALETRPRP